VVSFVVVFVFALSQYSFYFIFFFVHVTIFVFVLVFVKPKIVSSEMLAEQAYHYLVRLSRYFIVIVFVSVSLCVLSC